MLNNIFYIFSSPPETRSDFIRSLIDVPRHPIWLAWLSWSRDLISPFRTDKHNLAVHQLAEVSCVPQNILSFRNIWWSFVVHFGPRSLVLFVQGVGQCDTFGGKYSMDFMFVILSIIFYIPDHVLHNPINLARICWGISSQLLFPLPAICSLNISASREETGEWVVNSTNSSSSSYHNLLTAHISSKRRCAEIISSLEARPSIIWERRATSHAHPACSLAK